MRLDCQYNCGHEWVGCHERWAHTHAKICGRVVAQREKPHKAIPLVNINANAKTATQNGKTVGEKYFC